MPNFIAFQFNDSDFHTALNQAICYIADNAYEELTLTSWREFTLRGLAAFTYLRRIDNWFAAQESRDYTWYFAETLVVSEVSKLEDLPANFDGYIFDTNRHLVFYKGF